LPYNFSPVNQYNLQVSASFWNPIIRYVSHRSSGVRLNLKLGRTSADTTSYVLAREVDFAFTNHLFSPDRKRWAGPCSAAATRRRCGRRSWCRPIRR
jgi:phosphonate transport system substrate-binding protein